MNKTNVIIKTNPETQRELFYLYFPDDTKLYLGDVKAGAILNEIMKMDLDVIAEASASFVSAGELTFENFTYCIKALSNRNKMNNAFNHLKASKDIDSVGLRDDETPVFISLIIMWHCWPTFKTTIRTEYNSVPHYRETLNHWGYILGYTPDKAGSETDYIDIKNMDVDIPSDLGTFPKSCTALRTAKLLASFCENSEFKNDKQTKLSICKIHCTPKFWHLERTRELSRNQTIDEEEEEKISANYHLALYALQEGITDLLEKETNRLKLSSSEIKRIEKTIREMRKTTAQILQANASTYDPMKDVIKYYTEPDKSISNLIEIGNEFLDIFDKLINSQTSNSFALFNNKDTDGLKNVIRLYRRLLNEVIPRKQECHLQRFAGVTYDREFYIDNRELISCNRLGSFEHYYVLFNEDASLSIEYFPLNAPLDTNAAILACTAQKAQISDTLTISSNVKELLDALVYSAVLSDIPFSICPFCKKPYLHLKPKQTYCNSCELEIKKRKDARWKALNNINKKTNHRKRFLNTVISKYYKEIQAFMKEVGAAYLNKAEIPYETFEKWCQNLSSIKLSEYSHA